jgi:hypothetical protein
MTEKKMTPAEAGKFLRDIAQMTSTNSRDWDNFEAIATQIIEDAYKGGKAAGDKAVGGEG